MAIAELYVDQDMLATLMPLLPPGFRMVSLVLDEEHRRYVIKLYSAHLPAEVKRVKLVITDTPWTRSITVTPVEV